METMVASARAALFAGRKRPAVWTVTATWLVLALVFGLGIPYLVYRVLSRDPEEAEAAQALLTTVLPDELVPTTIGLFPMFGGAIVLVLGALTVGNEYRWGTFNLLFTQRPRRSQVIGGQAIALIVITLLLAVATVVTVAAATALVAVVEGRAVAWPTAAAVVRLVGAAWLICAAHASFGFLLAIVFRSTATAIAVGLLWTMIIENAVSGLAQVLAPLTVVRAVLLAPSSGALAGALGARSQFDGGTPGVVEATNGWLPALVLICYTAVAVTVAMWLAARRDVS
jgi:ABC-type transport system involved in multi-copper enzyme maturation permease subunit